MVIIVFCFYYDVRMLLKNQVSWLNLAFQVFMKTFKALSYISEYLSYVYKTFHTQHNKFYNFITKGRR